MARLQNVSALQNPHVEATHRTKKDKTLLQNCLALLKGYAKLEGVPKGRRFPDLDMSILFCPFWDFRGFSRISSDFFRDFPDLSFSSFSAN